MNWDEDIDLLSKKKKGRRSSALSTRRMSQDLETPNDSLSLSPEAPVRARRTSVWTEEGTKSKNGKSSNLIEQERFQSQKNRESDDDIPVIPDIDDLQDDPLNLPDVKPIVSIDKNTYKELDNQLENIQSESLNFGNLGDIDLSFLTSRLYPEKEAQFTNEIWTMESLFEEISRAG